MRRLFVVFAVLLAIAIGPARAHVPRAETQRYRTSAHLGPWISSDDNCEFLRNVTVACFFLESMESEVRITIDDRTSDEPISGLAEFRVGGTWSGYAGAQRFCGDGSSALTVPSGATAMLVRTAIPGMDYTWCLRGVGIPVTGTITAAFS